MGWGRTVAARWARELCDVTISVLVAPQFIVSRVFVRVAFQWVRLVLSFVGHVAVGLVFLDEVRLATSVVFSCISSFLTSARILCFKISNLGP